MSVQDEMNRWFEQNFFQALERLREEQDRIADSFIVQQPKPFEVPRFYYTSSTKKTFAPVLCTPVNESCKYLTMHTIYSTISGAPKGVRQRCVHPHHDRYELLRLNFKEFIQHVFEAVSKYHKYTGPQEFKEIILPPRSEVRLMQECIQTLEKVCNLMLERLNTEFPLEELNCDNKEYTKQK